MSTINTLAMKFRTQDDKTRIVNLAYCKLTATEAEAKALMDSMITGDAFAYSPEVKLGADIVQRTVAKLF